MKVESIKLHTEQGYPMVSALIEGRWHVLENVVAFAVNADSNDVEATLILADTSGTRLELDLQVFPDDVATKGA